MHHDLKDTAIIIAGANWDTGDAATIRLAKPGATIVMACRSGERGLPAPNTEHGK